MKKSYKAIFMGAVLSLPLVAVSQAADLDAGAASSISFLDEIDYNAKIERPDFYSQVDTTPTDILDDAANLYMEAHNSIRRMSIVRPDVTALVNNAMSETFRATSSCRYIDYPKMQSSEDIDRLKVSLNLLDMCNGPEQGVMQVTESFLKTMTHNLDPHSNYHTAEETDELSQGFIGLFGGIGTLLTRTDEGYKIEEPQEDGPAYAAGIQAGDVITAIEGIKLEGLEEKDRPELRGEIGAPVKLTIRRNDRAFDLSIIRALIRDNPVRSFMVDDEIAYLQLRTFANQGAAVYLANAIKEMQSTHGNAIKGYVLDLRGNTGGFLDQGRYTADMFLNSGLITTVGSAQNLQETQHYAAQGDIIDGMPLAVLINDYSASASEIVTAALQDHGRAIIVGNRSYGKGSVQSMLPLSNGGTLRLTSQLYFTPDGNSIQGRGIQPDIKYVPLTPPEQEPEYAHPIDNLPNGITYDDHRSSQTCSAAPNDPVAHTQKGLTFADGSIDYALLCAVETLRNEERSTVRYPLYDGPSV